MQFVDEDYLADNSIAPSKKNQHSTFINLLPPSKKQKETKETKDDFKEVVNQSEKKKQDHYYISF